MIKNKRTSYGLDKVTASIMDVDNSSLFDIFVPKQLRAGKNEIRIRLVNDGLVKGSDVLIDILDQTSEPLYYEISEIANEDKSRSIIVHVTETDLTGKAALYIYSKLGYDSSYMAVINLEVNPELESEQEIKFSNPPSILYSETRLATQTFSNQSRQVIKPNLTGTLSTISPTIPRQMIDSVFTVEKSEVREFKSTNSIGSGSTIQLPQYFDLARITSNNFPFSSSYKNGGIEIRGINLEVPNDAVSSVPFLNQRYSASIINVISTSSIEVYPPFSKLIEYQTSNGIKTISFDRFSNQSNFTCSYLEPLVLSKTNYTQSYAVFDVHDITPSVGKVDSLDISYKNLSLIGDNYEPLGNFKVRSINYLIDSGSLFFDNEHGIIERPIGIFKNGVTDFQTYWQTSSLATIALTNSVTNGIRFSGNDLIFQPKQQFNPVNKTKTEWKLTFDFNLESSQSLQPQLDIFISGSNNISIETQPEPVLYPLVTGGIYIGSIIERAGVGSFTFVVGDNARITPKFALRRGFISIGNVTLTPVEKVGYNANQTRIYAPLNLPTGSEVNFKIEYVNPVGKRLNSFSSLLPGVYFQGSTGINTGTSLTIPNGTVSGSDQLTSSFDDRYHKLGTGLLSSSNQIATDISGSVRSKIEPLNAFTGSTNQRLTNIELATSSYAVKTEVSGAFNQTSSSLSTRIFNLEIKSGSYVQTGSYSQDSGSWNTKINSINVRTGSYATTGSNTFVGSQTITGSVAVSSSITAREFAGIFNGVPTSSAQIKVLLPTSTVSGSEQLTSSYDVRYERTGTGIISSSNQIANDISGSFTLVSSSFASRISTFETKTLVSSSVQLTSSYDLRYERLGTGIFSSSNQVDYNQITNKIRTSGSYLNGLMISSGSDGSSSYADPNIKWIPGPGTSSRFELLADINLNGNINYTGSYAIKMQYTWSGPIAVSGQPGIIWTNMPNLKTTWLSNSDGTLTSDATFATCVIGYTQCQLVTYMRFGGATATSSLAVEYSLDDTTWADLVSLTIGNSSGKKITPWTRIPAPLATAGTASIRLVGQGGNGAADPQFSPPHLLFR